MTRSTEDRFSDIQKKIAVAYLGNENANVKKPFYINDKGLVPQGFATATEVILNRDMQDSSPFLQLINVLPKKQQRGGSLTIASQSRVTRTHDTYSGVERTLNKPKPSVFNEYQMVKAHADYILHDDDIDSMSEFPEWADMYRAGFFEALGNDRIIVGWWGKEHAVTSDLTTNKLLEDVNKGWLTLLEERASSQLLIKDEIKIGRGEGNDYANLDHMIQDVYQAIPMHLRSVGMTVLLSEALKGYSDLAYYRDQGGTPTEKMQIANAGVTGSYGGLDVVVAPFMPETVFLITGLKRKGNSFSNLSIYWQKDSWKRSVEYKAQIESSIDWNARREAYHIEDLRAIAGIKAKKIIFTDYGKDPDGNWLGEIDINSFNNWE